VHVVGHQAIGVNDETVPLCLGLEHVKVVPAIVIDEEDVLPIVPMLRDVMRHTDDNGSGFACHGRYRVPRRGGVSRK